MSTAVPVFLLLFTILSNSFYGAAGVTNPFTNSGAKIEKVTKNTLDEKYHVTLKYSPEPLKNGEPAFFMVNMFSNADGKQIRMRHVDCDFIILRDKQELYRLSSQYGEPQYHSINGIILASFNFNESGMYTVSIKITGELFIPINPVFANFSGIVTQEPGGIMKIAFT